MMSAERLKILDEYAMTSRLFSDAVERLRHSTTDSERFICALAETGTARRACERWRKKLARHLVESLGRGSAVGAAEDSDRRAILLAPPGSKI